MTITSDKMADKISYIYTQNIIKDEIKNIVRVQNQVYLFVSSTFTNKSNFCFEGTFTFGTLT